VRYQEWYTKLVEIHSKATPLLVDEELFTESVIIDKDKYTVFLGDTITFRKNDLVTARLGDWEIKKLYSAKEKSWQVLLGGLETKVKMAEKFNETLISAVVEPYLKEAILDRLTGAEDQSNEQILRIATAKRMAKLKRLLPKIDYSIFDGTFELHSPSKNYSLEVKYDADPAILFGGEKDIIGLKKCWCFLRNYDEIHDEVKALIEVLKPVMAMCQKAKEVK